MRSTLALRLLLLLGLLLPGYSPAGDPGTSEAQAQRRLRDCLDDHSVEHCLAAAAETKKTDEVARILARIEAKKAQEASDEGQRAAARVQRLKRLRYVGDGSLPTVWYLEQVCRGPAPMAEQAEACERLREADVRIAQDEMAAATARQSSQKK